MIFFHIKSKYFIFYLSNSRPIEHAPAITLSKHRNKLYCLKSIQKMPLITKSINHWNRTRNSPIINW